MRKDGFQLDDRTTRRAGYGVNQRLRKRIEDTLGWGKTIGLSRQVKGRGLDKVNAVCLLETPFQKIQMRTL